MTSLADELRALLRGIGPFIGGTYSARLERIAAEVERLESKRTAMLAALAACGVEQAQAPYIPGPESGDE